MFVAENVSIAHAFASLLVAVAGLELVWWVWRRKRYDLHKMPGPKPLPFIGHAHLLPGGNKPQLSAKIHEWALEYGKLYRLQVLGENMVVVHDPKFIEEQLHTSAHKDTPKASTYQHFNKLLNPHNTNGIFTSSKPDAKYRSFRKTMAACFSSIGLKQGYPHFLAKAKQVASKIEAERKAGASIDMQGMGVRFALDCIGHFAYDLDFNSVDNKAHPLLEALEFTTADAMAGYSNPFWEPYKKVMPFTALAKKTRKMYQQLYHEYDKILKAIDLEGSPPAEEDVSIRAQLMRMKNPIENNRKATLEEMYIEMAGFVVAGTDTTGHQLGWTMMCLCTHPEVQDRVFKELVENGLAGKGCRDPEYGDLANLTYLSQVLKETLRRVSSAPAPSMRQIEKDMDVLGYRVPKGTLVMGQPHTLNTCPWMWTNGDEFNPDRWNKDQGDEAAQRIWTFSSGARNCVGQRLAMLELQMLLAVLLSKFRFDLDPRMGGWDGAIKRSFNSLTLCCEGGMWIRAEHRN
ncbi:hypothetical protein BSKO_09055 [Bryopsis sp. KO-2023]|nr:hypothetical protein BSKO_09055 [Bryopsis sp. KO-2023]